MSNSMNQFNHPVEYIQLQKDNYLFLDPRYNCEYSLQQLLKKLGDSAGTILLPDKSITITKPIVLKPWQSIKGMGLNTEIIAFGFSGPAITFSSWCSISNIKLVGNNSANSVGISGNPHSAFFRISNVSCFYFKKGVAFKDCYIGTLDNLVSNHNDIGMEWDGFVNAINLIGGHIGSNRIGIEMLPNGMLMKNTISSTIEGNREIGIHVNSNIGALSIRDCYFESNGNNEGLGGDVVVENLSGALVHGITIDGCFGLRSSPMIHLKGGKGTKISNNTGWVKNFLKVESAAVDTVIDHNTFYTIADYDTCIGIIDESDTTKYTAYTSKNINNALFSPRNEKRKKPSDKFNPNSGPLTMVFE